MPSVMAKMGTEEDDGDPSVARRWRLVLSLGETRPHLAIVCETGLQIENGRGNASRFELMLDAAAFQAGIG